MDIIKVHIIYCINLAYLGCLKSVTRGEKWRSESRKKRIENRHVRWQTNFPVVNPTQVTNGPTQTHREKAINRRLCLCLHAHTHALKTTLKTETEHSHSHSHSLKNQSTPLIRYSQRACFLLQLTLAEVRLFSLHCFYFFVLCSIFLLFRVGFGFLLLFFLGFCCIKLCDWFGLGNSNIASWVFKVSGGFFWLNVGIIGVFLLIRL